MAKQWPSVEYVKGFYSIKKISALNQNEVYVILDYQLTCPSYDKNMTIGILTILDRNMQEHRIWSVTMIDRNIADLELPKVMVYEGLKEFKNGGKKVHRVDFAPVPREEGYGWIWDYYERRRGNKKDLTSNMSVLQLMSGKEDEEEEKREDREQLKVLYLLYLLIEIIYVCICICINLLFERHRKQTLVCFLCVSIRVLLQ